MCQRSKAKVCSMDISPNRDFLQWTSDELLHDNAVLWQKYLSVFTNVQLIYRFIYLDTCAVLYMPMHEHRFVYICDIYQECDLKQDAKLGMSSYDWVLITSKGKPSSNDQILNLLRPPLSVVATCLTSPRNTRKYHGL